MCVCVFIHPCSKYVIVILLKNSNYKLHMHRYNTFTTCIGVFMNSVICWTHTPKVAYCFHTHCISSAVMKTSCTFKNICCERGWCREEWNVIITLISHISVVHIQNHFRFQSLRILITFTRAVITLQHVTITTVTVEGTLSVDTLMFTSSISYITLINIQIS